MTSSEIDEIRLIIEKDLEWRQAELALLYNLLNNATGITHDEIETQRKIIRKSILLSMYAHFEGYFRFAFETYAYSLNEAKVSIDKVIDVLFISALNLDFEAYDEVNKWVMPDSDENNKRIKRLSNRLQLIQKLTNKGTTILKLPVSSNFSDKASVIHTESNLNPDVMDKILYGLGVHRALGFSDIKAFKKLMGLTGEFVRKRNGIAHGDNKSEYREGINGKEFASFENTFNTIITLIAPIITQCLTDKLYLKEQFR